MKSEHSKEDQGQTNNEMGSVALSEYVIMTTV